MTTRNDTIIGDIKAAITEHNKHSSPQRGDRVRLSRERHLAQVVESLTIEAAHAFGKLNGWHTGPGVRAFPVDDIGRRSARTYARLSSELFDHCVWYRGDGKCAAIVAQPYKHAKDDYAREIAAKAGVAVHIPPHELASFHYPGWTKFYVFTAVAHRIVWLPEQLNGIASKEENSCQLPT